jgi:hypothetical protein
MVLRWISAYIAVRLFDQDIVNLFLTSVYFVRKLGMFSTITTSGHHNFLGIYFLGLLQRYLNQLVFEGKN